MRKKICVLFLIAVILGAATEAFALKINHYREEQYIRLEATRRKIMIIPIAQAQAIALSYIGTRDATFENIELYNDAAKNTESFSEFRPVFKMQCVTRAGSYDVKIDASTGRILN